MTQTIIEEGSGIEQSYGFQNHTGLPDRTILSDGGFRAAAKEISKWAQNLRVAQQKGTMFDRAAYTPPENIYDEMRSARIAITNDDVVSGVADITESFAFQGVKWESTDADEADIFNQWAADINLDGLLRRIWREEFACSQAIVAMIWGWREYTVRGRTIEADKDAAQPGAAGTPDTGALGTQIVNQPPNAPQLNAPGPVKKPRGRKRRKKYRLWVPVDVRVLDSTKIVPVDFSPMADETLAWFADEAEWQRYEQVNAGRLYDPGMEAFYLGKYTPPEAEADRLRAMGIDPERLLLLNPEMVWRHTLTKADYDRFADVRLKSCFGLLDLKRQLMNSDRAALIGAANYILLVRKGTDDMPAQQEEIDNLKENYNFIAKMPVIISDHRLDIEIVAPKTDLTLQAEKYDLLDTRLLMRMLGTLSLGARGQRNETNLTLSHAVARMMENRRHMIRRALEKNIARVVVEHRRNRNPDGSQKIENKPSLVFLPRHVTLGFDQALVQALMSLRTQREISRETILENFGLDQATEAMRMDYEEEVYDDIFQTRIPFAAPGVGGNPNNPNEPTGDPQSDGAKGGRPNGGGEPSGDATKVRPKTGDGNTRKGSS